MSIHVLLFVCSHISHFRNRTPNFTDFFVNVDVAVPQPSSGGVAMRYVLPVLYR